MLIANRGGVYGGGAERRIKLLVEEMIRRGTFEKIILLSSSEESKNIKKIKLDITAAQKKTILNFYYNEHDAGESYYFTKNLIKKFTLDIIQLHNMDDIGVLKAISESSMPTIFIAHDYWPLCGKRHFIDPYKARNEKVCLGSNVLKCVPCIGVRPYLKIKKIQRLMKKITLGIAPTKITRDIYEKHNVLVNKWKIVLPWIDTKVFKPLNKKKRGEDILFVGSLLDYKGAWVITEAFARISSIMPHSRLLFIGPNQEKGSIFRKKIENFAKKNGFSDKIVFMGVKSWKDIVKHSRRCGVYVCPTVWPELFGLNWAEALASGCPVVASRIGGIPELIDGCGILVEPRDHDALANAAIRILKNKKLAGELGESGSRMILKRFNVRRAADDFTKIYHDTISKKQGMTTGNKRPVKES